MPNKFMEENNQQRYRENSQNTKGSNVSYKKIKDNGRKWQKEYVTRKLIKTTQPREIKMSRNIKEGKTYDVTSKKKVEVGTRTETTQYYYGIS